MSFQSVSDYLGVLSFFDNNTLRYGEDASAITYKTLSKEILPMDELFSVISVILNKPWIGSLIGSFLVSLSGVFPVLFIHVDDDNSKKGGKFVYCRPRTY